MVPYTHSHGPSSSVLVDSVFDNHDSDPSLSPDKANDKEKRGDKPFDRFIANGRPGTRGFQSSTIEDEGGGGTDNSGEDGDITNSRWLGSGTQETSFIKAEGDTVPLLEGSGSDTETEGVGRVLIEDTNETSLQICLQVTLPYIIAGFGMVAAGMVLDKVQVGGVTPVTDTNKPE